MDEETGKCQHISKYIGEIHRASGIYFTKKFNKFGIGAGQYLFLLSLYKNKGITQEELAEKSKLDKATVARAIKKLEDQGYVRRVKKENDRRVYNIIITEKAESIKDEVYSIMNEWESMVQSFLTKGEAKELLKLLNKLANSSLFD